MPPSPAMRCSPGREPRGDNHKRGRSLESGMPLKHRDDDLALFNEVQNRERDNFLLQGNDDFEDIFANKLRHFSDYKLGINIPARGETSDLLHAEEEKNDYEWLITPPDTPLFTSLDDEAPQVNLAQRGRTRTQPISISRSSTMEKSHRNSRGSASPNRASPNRASPNRVSLSPRSHNSTFESRGRAYSATSASPPTTFRPTTTATALRSSPPPSRKPLPRASTPPPPQRLSTGSNGTTTPTRGISGKTSRGNSASPKVKAWESSIPGFSTEVPPNLRTSLVDRPASYVRGSSPASRNSRQSMSPTASRSISSSHSKGSVASSGEDDMESLSSVVVGRLNLRRGGGFQNKKVSPSKKPSRTVSSSSAPKRSFDLALRQMDHRKGPHNMFRPLLSSVPSSTFHVGIATSPHHTITSRNSSVTTSSNASSGLGTSGPHDHEASQDDATSGYAKIQDFDVNDDVFMIEKDETHDPFFDDSRKKTDLDPTSLIPDATYQKGLLICSRCGCGYSPIVENTNLCPDCIDSYSPLTFVDPSIAVSQSEPEEIVGVESLEVMGNVKPSGLSEVESLEGVDFLKSKVESLEGVDFLKPKAESSEGVDLLNSKAESLEGVDLLKPKDESLESVDLLKPKDESLEGVDFLKPKVESLQGVDFLKPKVESLEGVAGISLLLKRSNSIKGTVVRNTNFSASSISYDDLSYVRENNTSSMRSVSASSSVDFGHVKHANNTRFQRQSSSTKSESEHSNASFHPSNLGTTTLDQENVNNSNLEPLKVKEDVSFQKDEDSGVDDSPAIDVAEASLEGELGQTFRSSPPSKCDMSSSSTSSIEELQENVTVSVEECHVSNHTSNIIGESVVLIEDEGLKGRSLTLEEATDTILFCSSIVQRLALNAATIAIEKETESDENKSWPLIPATRKSELDKPEFQIRTPTKRSSKSQRSKHKKEVENDTNTPATTTTTEKNVQPKTRIIGVREPNNGESKKPPLLESKCNCTIM